MRALWWLLAVVACKHSVERAPPPTAPSALAGPTVVASTELFAVPAEIAAKVTLRRVAHGLDRPVLLTTAPSDPRKRLFVIEQRGAIRVIENGELRAKKFFTISGLSDGNEEGLLGLAFHPKFATNGKLYVDYTSADMATHIVEYRVSASDPDVVDAATAREIIRIAQPYSNHNGGDLVFGPDGKLYTGMGDGGAANDPHRNGQNPKALLAKILRFDVDGAAQPEIVDLGVRNPWRFWFDAITHDLYIGDVGQNLWENVYVVPNDGVVHNMGWNVVEGNHCFDADSGAGASHCDKTGFTPPAVDYGHDQGCSVTGGVTYRGKALPALDGRYFYADFCTGLIRSFRWFDGAVHEHWDWREALVKASKLEPAQISSFGVDGDGEVYIVSLLGDIFELAPH
ncbi:MAG: PQQ-dependent sugar dehydrogenase [Kofleriaceae bacterium]